MAILLAALGAVPWTPDRPARAAEARAGHAAALVPGACRADIARFCPSMDAAAPGRRSAAICLKPYKTSLSLPCRKAVRAVFP